MFAVGKDYFSIYLAKPDSSWATDKMKAVTAEYFRVCLNHGHTEKTSFSKFTNINGRSGKKDMCNYNAVTKIIL